MAYLKTKAQQNFHTTARFPNGTPLFPQHSPVDVFTWVNDYEALDKESRGEEVIWAEEENIVSILEHLYPSPVPSRGRILELSRKTSYAVLDYPVVCLTTEHPSPYDRLVLGTGSKPVENIGELLGLTKLSPVYIESSYQYAMSFATNTKPRSLHLPPNVIEIPSTCYKYTLMDQSIVEEIIRYQNRRQRRKKIKPPAPKPEVTVQMPTFWEVWLLAVSMNIQTESVTNNMVKVRLPRSSAPSYSKIGSFLYTSYRSYRLFCKPEVRSAEIRKKAKDYLKRMLLLNNLSKIEKWPSKKLVYEVCTTLANIANLIVISDEKH